VTATEVVGSAVLDEVVGSAVVDGCGAVIGDEVAVVVRHGVGRRRAGRRSVAHAPICAALGDDRPDDGRRHLLAARPIAESLGHAQLLAWDRAGIAMVDAMSGHFITAAAGLLDADMHAGVTGDPNITATVLAFRAQIAVQFGDAGRGSSRSTSS